MENIMTSQDRESRRKTISGLAMLTANLDSHRDYLDTFLPIIGQTILELKPKIISTQELQAKVSSEFGMQIPQNALKMLLNRAHNKGYLKKEGDAYVPIYNKLASLNFETLRNDVQRQQNAAVQKLIDFARKQHNIIISRDEGERALLDFIRQNDIDLLHCSIATGTAPLLQETQSSRKITFIINSFVINVFENDPEGFKYIDTLIKGTFLSHYLVFPDLDKVQKRFLKTEMFFDTSFIIRALGYEGSRFATPCIELLDLLYEEGAVSKCFRDTRNEVYNIMFACMSAIKTGTLEEGGPAYHYFYDNGYSPSQIELELALLDRNLSNLGIRIVDKPPIETKVQIDEQKLDEYLQNERSYWRENERPRIHDVTSLSSVYRIRQGHEFTHIEESLALFVTPNVGLCRVGSRFFIQEHYMQTSSVPIAITDYALTSIIWIKRPINQPNLPQQYVIAQCYAAIEPDAKLWKNYMTIVSRLKDIKTISPDDYYLLRYSQVAHNEMMGLTLGDEQAITEGTALEILDRVKEGIRQKDLALLAEERQRSQQKETAHLREISQVTNQKEDAIKMALLEKEQHSMKIQRLTSNLEQIARRWAKLLSWVIFSLLLAFVTAGVLYTFVDTLHGMLEVVLLLAAIVLATFGLWNLVFGITINDLRSRFEVSIFKRLGTILKKRFLPLDE